MADYGRSNILDQYGYPYDRNGRNRQDAPLSSWDPNQPLDQLAAPAVITYSALVGSGLRAFWHGRYDAARRQSREDSLAMRREPWMMALMQERTLAVASLKWHLEVDDDRNRHERAMKNGLTKIIQASPRWKMMLWVLMQHLWYGRAGVQWLYKWGSLGNRRALGVRAFYPVNGDKIGYQYDHTPYILINPSQTDQLRGRAETILTTEGGYGLVLKGSWRERFCISSHIPEDRDYFSPEEADAMHGVGLRDVLAWSRWMRFEFLGNVVDWAERVGLGTTIFYYQHGNTKSEAAANQAAHDMSRRSVIVWPRFNDGKVGGDGVERVEVPSNGAQLLLAMQEHLEEAEERYVVGQSLSGGIEGSGLGDKAHAAASDTKYRITSFDAANLGEAITGSEDNPGLVWSIKRWTFPEMRSAPCRLVFDVDPPDSERVLGAVVQCIGVDVDFIKDDVRALTGLSAPGPDDEVISSLTILKTQLRAQMEAQMEMQQAGMGGQQQPGQPGGEEDPHKELLDKMGAPDPYDQIGQEGGQPQDGQEQSQQMRRREVVHA